MDLAEVARVTRRLAIEAGEAILAVYERPDFDVRFKGDDSPLTEADEAADRVISAGLRAAFPNVALVTEEQAESHEVEAAQFFIVDPLDGTKEFVQRRGDFTVNIALVEHGIPVAGVVYAPAKGRMFYTTGAGQAVEEAAPFARDHTGLQAVLQMRAPDTDAVIVVASKSHRDQATDDYIARFKVADVRSAGSSLKFCLLAAGEADLYPRLGRTMEWDTAAGDAVLRAAGGDVVDLNSHQPLRYGKAGYDNPFFVARHPDIALP
ncbi:MAG: 3'(2'),5'-bisphosphate nucleotidase [Rhodobacteraceae bacterium]|nr:MAG: 3'(2'),5'-bisphosphate nucleotidase [Paracoccaceae bacterium]